MIIHRILLLSSIFCVGCSTYSIKVREPIRLLEQGQYQDAQNQLEVLAQEPGGDQLAYTLEYALAGQLAGNYKESNLAFHKADNLSEVKDYISLSDEAASLVFSESMVAYKGDDFEKMMINVFSAMNYAALENYESALVEIRRLNEKLNNYRQKAGRDYSDNPFAYYLSAVMWEKQKQFDDACIDYKKVSKDFPNLSFLVDDLLYCSYKSGNWTALRDYKKKFGIKSYGRSDVKKKEAKGEVLVIIHQGPGPVKVPNLAWHRVPSFRSRLTNTNSVRVGYSIDQKHESQESVELVSLEKLAIDSLKKQYAKLIAKRIAGKIAKDQIRQQIKKEDEGAALIAQIIMDVTDQADLRQWSSLPKALQVVRLSLPEGSHKLHFSKLDGSRQGFPWLEKEVQIKSGKMKILFLKAM